MMKRKSRLESSLRKKKKEEEALEKQDNSNT